MYPESDIRGAVEAQRMTGMGLGYANEIKQPGAIQEAINRANGIVNLLENTNGLLDNSLSRISGGVPVADGRNTQNAPMPAGDVGLLMATLDRIDSLVELNSNYAGQVARL